MSLRQNLREISDDEEEEREESSDDFEESRHRAKRNKAADAHAHAPSHKPYQRLFGMSIKFFPTIMVEFVIVIGDFSNPRTI